ncbi:hypothetical protein PR048_024202 [Dryococelus australis]|uniref:Uncharacterized protein n=1 Tax=Dryococelus australis TaxID=614101 RepID=A0ABQ9GWA5_9NEOP|nr:hypothetical protein PR048_024202 [Dryococelus australis]
MEQRRNERTGETGDPRENPQTSDIIRHDSHIRKPGNDTGRGLNPVNLGQGYVVHPQDAGQGYVVHPQDAGQGYIVHPQDAGQGYVVHPQEFTLWK